MGEYGWEICKKSDAIVDAQNASKTANNAKGEAKGITLSQGLLKVLEDLKMGNIALLMKNKR